MTSKPLAHEPSIFVHVFVAVGLCLSWWLQGMGQLFLGFLFLLAIPTIQARP